MNRKQGSLQAYARGPAPPLAHCLGFSDSKELWLVGGGTFLELGTSILGKHALSVKGISRQSDPEHGLEEVA